MIIDYLGHSGFLVETERLLLLFDYYRGDLSLLDGKPPEKPLFVFASHAHKDHFNPAIFSLAERRQNVRYIFSFDIRGNPAVPSDADVAWLEADETYDIPGLGKVKTLLSTDEGVAFLVETGSETLFHAGDLHWWDWKGEDPAWLDQQEQVFKREIGALADVKPDAAFVVLDDRLEENFAEGLLWFLSVCRPACVLPMHYWQDDTVIDRFKALPGSEVPGVRLLDTAKESHWEI